MRILDKALVPLGRALRGKRAGDQHSVPKGSTPIFGETESQPT
jgi:hypothetical protein